jgi:hypothetical protein
LSGRLCMRLYARLFARMARVFTRLLPWLLRWAPCSCAPAPAVGPQAAPRIERRAAETDCQCARASRVCIRRARAGPRLCRVADAQGVPLECRGRHAQHARRVHGCHDQDHMPPVLPPGAHSLPSPRADCRSRPAFRVHSQPCSASFMVVTCRALEMAAGPVWGR